MLFDTFYYLFVVFQVRAGDGVPGTGFIVYFALAGKVKILPSASSSAEL